MLGASLGQQISQGGQQEQTLSPTEMSTGDFARMDGAGYRSTPYDAGAAWAADVAARRAANPVYTAPMAQDEMLGGREDVNGLDLQSDQYAGGRRTVTIGNNQGVLAAMGAAGLSPAEQRAAYGQLIRSGQLTAADFDAKGMPKVQAGQEFNLDSNDYTPGDARLGGRLIGAESSNRTAIEVARATAQAAADRARWDTLQVGAWSGRTNQVTTGVQASGPAMVSQDVYTAAGDYAGSEMVPASGAGAGMPYAQSVGKALAATVEIGYGAFKGVVNGVPEMAVGALKGYAYIGAGLRDGIDSATGAPSQNYLGRAIEAGSAYSGEVLSYEGNGLQRMGGYAGELLSPGAYAKAGGLGVMGLRALGPTLDAAATNYMSKNGMMIFAVPEEAGGALSSARLDYMGRTPDKYSRTGAEVVERMRGEGLIQGEGALLRGNPNGLTLKTDSGNFVNIDASVDMAHRIDAVSWWNSTGVNYGARAPEVRSFMLDSKNYVLQPSSQNRSAGAQLGITYNPVKLQRQK